MGEVLSGELFSGTGSQSGRGGQLMACRRGEAWCIFLQSVVSYVEMFGQAGLPAHSEHALSSLRNLRQLPPYSVARGVSFWHLPATWTLQLGRLLLTSPCSLDPQRLP